jgi:predicted nucleic acid-binding protein
MDHLVDTNVLLRSVQHASPAYRYARSAIVTLLRRGDRLCIVPRNMAEFWSVATRPAEKNGLGLSLPQADWYVSRLEAILTLLNDTPAMHREWRSLVVAHAVAGPRVYDARLVAAMTVYGITSILTFSGDDFKRYPGVHVIHPQAVSGQTP